MKSLQMALVCGLIAVGLLIATASNTSAFDGDRKGFVLGGGIGGGTATLKQELSGAGAFSGEGESQTKGTVATDFRIGGAFNEQWMLYYDNQVWWGSIDFESGKDTFIFGIGLVGLSYYFTADSPSLYVVGTIGVSSFGPSDDYTAQSGLGLSGGLGYEFARHWSVEAVVGWGSPEEESSGVTLTTDGFVFAVRVHGLAY